MSPAATKVKALTNFITSPGKVAHCLDWRKASGGTLLNLNITRDSIDLAVASHPEFEEEPEHLSPLTVSTQIINHEDHTNHKILLPEVPEELASILHDFRVCAMVVNWPMQKEGWCGAPCGRVLFTLDQLVKSTYGNQIFNGSRKVCLWNVVPGQEDFSEDSWGRASVYCTKSKEEKTLHFASIEQYPFPQTTALDIWNDFCSKHWPQLFDYGHNRTGASKTSAAKTASPSLSSASHAAGKKNNVGAVLSNLSVFDVSASKDIRLL